MPYLMDCVRAYATLGEIIAVMKEVFGLYEESTVI
jgi:methylmalonyl-CoA mutase N-terminal domain/subunit